MAKKAATSPNQTIETTPSTELATAAAVPQMGDLVKLSSGVVNFEITREEIAKRYASQLRRKFDNAARDAVEEAKALAIRISDLKQALKDNVIEYQSLELYSQANELIAALEATSRLNTRAPMTYSFRRLENTLRPDSVEVAIAIAESPGIHSGRDTSLVFRQYLDLTPTTKGLVSQIEESEKQHQAKLKEAQALKHRASQRQDIEDEAFEMLTTAALGQNEQTKQLDVYLGSQAESSFENELARIVKSSS